MKKKIVALMASCALALAGCGDADVIMEAVRELESVLDVEGGRDRPCRYL